MLNGMVLTDDAALRNDIGMSTPVRLRQFGFSDIIVQELKHSSSMLIMKPPTQLSCVNCRQDCP